MLSHFELRVPNSAGHGVYVALFFALDAEPVELCIRIIIAYLLFFICDIQFVGREARGIDLLKRSASGKVGASASRRHASANRWGGILLRTALPPRSA